MDLSDLKKQGEKIPVQYFELPDKNLLLEELTALVHDLLTNDFQRLKLLLYRHDVNEKAVARAMASGNTTEEQAANIARLVLDRELEKVASRKAYREYKRRTERNRLTE